jgi:hypothetical protein
MPPTARNVLLLAAIFCAVNAASAQQQFTATLQPVLAPGSFNTGTELTLASPTDLSQFTQKPPPPRPST